MFSPDDQFIVSGSSDKTMKILRVYSESLVPAFNTSGTRTKAAFAPTGAHVAV